MKRNSGILPLVLLPFLLGRAAAQELPLKREVPEIAWTGCQPVTRTVADTVTEDRRLVGERVASGATQAALLGENARALELLDQAAAADPWSADIAYRLARALEDNSRPRDALAAYCRALGLAPDGPEAPDVRDRISALGKPRGFAVPAEAAAAFYEGVRHFDARTFARADSAFGEAVLLVPAWGDAVYNRGVARSAQGLRDQAAEDLREYLRLSAESPDVVRLLGVLDTLGPSPIAAPRSAAGGALMRGLLVPGLGQLTTGRPGIGLLLLGVAGGLVAGGLQIENVKVDCLAPPVNGSCPAGQVLRQRTERPYLYPAVAAAAAVGIFGAIDAFRGVHRREARAAEAAAPVVIERPEVAVGPDGVRLDLVRLRF